MKKILLSFSMLLFSAGAFAQKNVIKMNFVGAFLGSYTLAYERVITKSASLQLSVGYRMVNYTIQDYTYNYSGPTIVGEFRYYLTSSTMDLPKGFYLAPFVRYGEYKWTITDRGNDSGTPGYYNGSYTTSTIGGGLMFGYQFLVAKRLTFDLFIGPQYKTKNASGIRFNDPYVQANSYNDPYAPIIDNKTKEGVGVRTGFTLGVAF
jgi:hypothetical protein